MKIGVNVKKIYETINEYLEEMFIDIAQMVENHESRISTLENGSGGSGGGAISNYVLDFYNYEKSFLKSTNTQILNDKKMLFSLSYSGYFLNFDIAPIEHNRLNLGSFKVCNTSQSSNLFECYGTIPCIYQVGTSTNSYNGLIQVSHHSTTDEVGNSDNYCSMELCINPNDKALFTDNPNILNETFKFQADGIITADVILM